jgi:hypothetical protein
MPPTKVKATLPKKSTKKKPTKKDASPYKDRQLNLSFPEK